MFAIFSDSFNSLPSHKLSTKNQLFRHIRCLPIFVFFLIFALAKFFAIRCFSTIKTLISFRLYHIRADQITLGLLGQIINVKKFNHRYLFLIVPMAQIMDCSTIFNYIGPITPTAQFYIDFCHYLYFYQVILNVHSSQTLFN